MKQPLAPRVDAPHSDNAATARAQHSGFGSVSANGTARSRSHGAKHARKISRHRARHFIALALTGVLAFTGAGAATAAFQLSANIDHVSMDDIFHYIQRPDAPQFLASGDDTAQVPPLNILLLGTDGRDSAENRELGGGNDASNRSDTAIIMNISGDRQRVSMVSIPRDSIVDIPACPTTTPGRFTTPRPQTRFNAAFAYGSVAGGDTGSGAACAMYTLEQITNVRLDGFIAVDFAGFRNMVDSLGGVEMCIPNAIFSPLAGGLRLDPGLQTLNGWQALQFARARTGRGLGDGSDLNRIGRQQELLGAIALDVLGRNLLTDAPALLQFLGATTSSLTMSDNLASVSGLAGLASSMQNIRPNNIEFITVPNMLNPENRNTVVWLPEAEIVWEALRTGESVADTQAAIEAAAQTPEAPDTPDVNGVYANGTAPSGSVPGVSGIEAGAATNGGNSAAGNGTAGADQSPTPAETAAPAAPSPRPTIVATHPVAPPVYCS
ncbi:MAG: LCP family protein [Cellulomonadaceae bacterium]|jgi:LCP family protein required for cell wall assembly|nr:LCP family protein [Cellulomonadaceae bacterium]